MTVVVAAAGPGADDQPALSLVAVLQRRQGGASPFHEEPVNHQRQVRRQAAAVAGRCQAGLQREAERGAIPGSLVATVAAARLRRDLLQRPQELGDLIAEAAAVTAVPCPREHDVGGLRRRRRRVHRTGRRRRRQRGHADDVAFVAVMRGRQEAQALRGEPPRPHLVPRRGAEPSSVGRGPHRDFHGRISAGWATHRAADR